MLDQHAAATKDDIEPDHAEPPETGEGERVRLLPLLMQWLRDPQRPRLVALLGEFGSGKTVACQMLTRHILAARAADPELPVPLYLDLRDLPAFAADARFDLNALIDAMMAKGGAAPPRAEDILEMVRAEKVLVIFDGLDEVTNKLSGDQAQRLYRELLRIVPEEAWRGEVTGPRLLVSCRDHFFKDLESQTALLAAQHRGGRAREHMEVYTLLPFTRAQIESNLRRHMPEDQAAAALELIDGTYDLAGLAARPVMLTFIRTLIDDLAAGKRAGRTIDLARLYDLLVKRTLERDELKHAIPVPEKRRLLEELALHLQKRGSQDLRWDRLDEWLQTEMEKLPKLRRALSGADAAKAAEAFAQDLRNASFLVRSGEAGFRFGHTSLREYFLAGALHRAVREGRGEEAFEIEDVSPEACEFTVRRHWGEEAAEKKAFEDAFPGLIKQGRPPRVRQVAFDIWKMSHDLVNASKAVDVAPLPRPEVMDLSGLVLNSRSFRKLALQRTNWTGAGLCLAEFESSDLQNAVFASCDLRGSQWTDCALEGAAINSCNLNGSEWRNLAVAPSRITNSTTEYALAVNCGAWRPQGVIPAGRLSLATPFNGMMTVRSDGRISLLYHVECRGKMALTGDAAVDLAAFQAFSPVDKVKQDANDALRRLRAVHCELLLAASPGVVREASSRNVASWVEYAEDSDGKLLQMTACGPDATRYWRIAVEGHDGLWPIEDALPDAAAVGTAGILPAASPGTGP